MFRSNRKETNRIIHKLSVPPGLFKIAAMFSFLVLLGCGTSKVEPVALAPEDMCAYCRMAVSERRYAGELIDSEGQAFKFDDIGCMVNFIKNKKSSTNILAYFVMDFEERQWIKADDAYYVRSSELTTPMNGGIIAFRNQPNAQEAVARYHGKLVRFKDIFNTNT